MTENAIESLRERMRRMWIAIGLLFVMNAALSLMLANLVAEHLDIFINFFNVAFVPLGFSWLEQCWRSDS